VILASTSVGAAAPAQPGQPSRETTMAAGIMVPAAGSFTGTAVINGWVPFKKEGTIMLPIKKIIATTDFSEASLNGVNAAVELAQTFDADLLLVHVTQPLQTVSGATTMAGYHLPTVEKEINAEVSQRADELIEKEIPASLRSEARILRGNPASEIADLAEKENADLIVIASKGDAAWKQALFGSVAEGVVRHAACPVMAVPAS